jgi:hypothetical protein
LPKYICRIISTIKKTNIGGTQLPDRGPPPHAIMYVLLDCYLRSQSSCLRWLSWYLVLSFVRRCSAFIQEVQLWGGWRPRGSVCSYKVNCPGNHGVQCWRGHTIVVSRSEYAIRLILDDWWLNNPVPVDVRGPPRLKSPIPPLYPRIKNTDKDILINNKIALILDVWWLINPAPVKLSGPPRLKTPIPHSNPQILNTHNGIWDQKEIGLILVVWWFNNPALVELRGPPCLGTRIPPFYPWILNTHILNFIQIKFILILDVWWFNNPALVELRGPPCLGTRIPPSNPEILNTYKKIHPNWIYTNFRCLVI